MTDIVEDTELLESTDTPEADPIADLEVTSHPTAADAAQAEVLPEPIDEPVIEDTVEVDEPITEDLTADTPVVDWEKRYNDQQSFVGTQSSELTRLRQDNDRYSALGDPQEAAHQLQQFKEQSAQQELKQWNPRSSEYSSFQALRAKADGVNQMINSAESPEARDAMIQAASGQFSTEDQATLNAFQEHNANTQRQLAEDPEGFLNNIIESRLEARFQEYEQYKGQQDTTSQYLSENSELIDKYRDDFTHLIGGQGSNRELALEFVQMKEEVAQYRAQFGKSLESQAQADAQGAAIKKSATVNRDLNNSVPNQDPVKLAQEKGLKGMDRLRFIENYNKGN